MPEGGCRPVGKFGSLDCRNGSREIDFFLSTVSDDYGFIHKEGILRKKCLQYILLFRQGERLCYIAENRDFQCDCTPP